VRNDPNIPDSQHVTRIWRQGERVTCEFVPPGPRFLKRVFCPHAVRLLSASRNGAAALALPDRRPSEAFAWYRWRTMAPPQAFGPTERLFLTFESTAPAPFEDHITVHWGEDLE